MKTVKSCAAFASRAICVLARKPIVAACLLVLLCAVTLLPKLGSHGFVNSEAHRAVPAFEMLETGEYVVPTLFGQTYLRKPPGMPWAIALSSTVFGTTEFAARFVSAVAWTLSVLVIFVFARRWFGARYGLLAALACVLWPWFWSTARSAEIEALHNMFATIAVLTLIDVLVWQKRRPSSELRTTLVRAAGMCALLSVSLVGMGASKGGAGIAAIVGAIIGAWIVRTRWRKKLDARESGRVVFGVLSIAGLCAALLTLTWLVPYSNIETKNAVTQSSSHFLWQTDKVHRVLILAMDALVAGLPWSLVVLWPWGPFARDEAQLAVVKGFDTSAADRLAVGQAVSLACFAGLAISMVAGVSNVRYTMPIMLPACVLVGYTMRGWQLHFGAVRRACYRVCTFGSPALAYVLLVVGIVVWSVMFEDRRSRLSGREIGATIGDAIANDMQSKHTQNAIVFADHLVEARPEILLAIRERSHAEPRWVTGLHELDALPSRNSGVYFAVRDDADSVEWSTMDSRGFLDHLTKIGSWTFRDYTIIVFRADAESKSP